MSTARLRELCFLLIPWLLLTTALLNAQDNATNCTWNYSWPSAGGRALGLLVPVSGHSR